MNEIKISTEISKSFEMFSKRNLDHTSYNASKKSFISVPRTALMRLEGTFLVTIS